MFRDIDVARDEMTAYNSIQRERRNRLPVDMNVNVLSAASWPSYPDVPVRIPPVVATAVNDFEQFYHNKYNGRKLQWKHQLAHCQLRSRFPKGDKELVVSSFQAIVLLLFNDVPEGETLEYPQIQEATLLCKSCHCRFNTEILTQIQRMQNCNVRYSLWLVPSTECSVRHPRVGRCSGQIDLRTTRDSRTPRCGSRSTKSN